MNTTEKPTRKEKNSMMMEELTDRIIKDLEAGTMPWDKDWFCVPSINGLTGKAYRGINVLILAAERFHKNYSSHVWLTYRQAQELEGRVKKGEKGTVIWFFDICSKDTDELDPQGQKVKETYPISRVYYVFNLDQVEGLDHLKDKFIPSKVSPIEAGEKIMKESGAVIEYAQINKAFFTEAGDKIVLPVRESYKSTQGFYNTVFHEITHWSGGKARLNRNFETRFEKESYAFEELIAELGGAFLSSHIGLSYTSNHASYIASWLKVLKNDKHAIFTASSQAQRACDFILKTTFEEKEA